MNSQEQSCSRLDNAFAHFLGLRSSLPDKQRSLFEQLIARLSSEQGQGHNCIQLTDEEMRLVLKTNLVAQKIPVQNGDCSFASLKPLVLDGRRLYLHRYWFYETRLAMEIKQMLSMTIKNRPLDGVFDRYFPKRIDEIDWQREAAEHVVILGFSIITGGPGTGKTTTVVKILGLIQELAEQTLLIALAAPTGKAAVRLQESISSHISSLPCSEQIKQSIPGSVTTVHSLLGAKADSPFFKHNADRPLPYDLVVVDEASMVDLALMSKLVDALKPGCRLILLGDKDQLASVESGAVLADVTAALPTHTHELKKAYRFDKQIKALSVAINHQQAELAWQYFQQGSENIVLLNDNLIAYIADQQTEYLSLIMAGTDFKAVFKAFNRFQVLCANRQGNFSVNDINFQVERALLDSALISLSGQWYKGRPVMVTRNNPTLQLFNGDIGICMPDPEQSNVLKVYFQTPDGKVRKVLPARLTECETVYAMTVHKSQGSEFDEILIVLPEKVNPILTKELIYTAITRAKKSVKLYADKAVFLQAVQHKVERFGGLIEKLNS